MPIIRAQSGLTRRQFFETSRGLGLLAAVVSQAGPAVAATAGPASLPVKEADLDALRRAFTDPPHAMRPMTRWWWFGGAVTPEEITRELTLMRDAGLRGAEIQPVYPVAVDDPARGIRHLRYFTEEWFAVLRHAVAEAGRLGLQLDFTLGSGWPYGGPFIPTNEASRCLRVLSQDVVGPRAFSWSFASLVGGDDKIVAVVAAPVLANGEPDLSRSQVLRDQPRTRGDNSVRDWPVPEGHWRLQVFLDAPTGMQVKRPTLGMEGNVLDHFRRESLDIFLRAAGDRVMSALRPNGEPPFHSVFCDSLEVYGADWTGDLLAEFRARRGYDLAPYLPALWQEAGRVTPHVRHDYHRTLSDLTLEKFFRPLVAWAEGRGMKARIQAHGAMGDVMQGYGLAHIPEGENIFGGDRMTVNLRHRRLASSAAHLYGKPLASAETYTWLRTPLYMTTLEMMKAATDAVFLDGINHVVNHGYSYSPPSAGEPGWAFYASTEANHTNTWWRHYPHLARYVQRCQAVLQRGASVNPVGVYLPLSDVYASHGAGGLHMDEAIEKRIDPALLPGLRRAGYDFDLVHDHALATFARVADGRLMAGNGDYAVMLVPGARFMPPESAARLVEMAEGGGHVVFIERVPEGAPGLHDQEAGNAEVARSLARLWGPEPPQIGSVRAAAKGSVALVADAAAAFARLEAVLAPDFRIVSAGSGGDAARQAALDNVGYVHRRDGSIDTYFVANISDRTHDLRVRVARDGVPERWNVETGRVEAVAHQRVRSSAGTGRTELTLGLEPFESCFLVFAPGAGAGLARAPRRERAAAPAVSIDGPWRLTLGGGAVIPLPRLVSWNDLPEGRAFSGWGTYEAEFDLPAPGAEREWTIDLGRVHETAQVWLNGQDLGAAWKGLRRRPCGRALRPGRNRLRVEVANLWIHHMAAQPPPDWRAVEETVGIRWGRYGEIKPPALPPSGLLGPVRLLAR